MNAPRKLHTTCVVLSREAFKHPFIQRETIKTASQRLPINCFDLLLCCIFLRKRKCLDVSSLHLDFGAGQGLSHFSPFGISFVIVYFCIFDLHANVFILLFTATWYAHILTLLWGNEQLSKNGCLTIGRHTSSSENQVSRW